jgi:hypothetical protein
MEMAGLAALQALPVALVLICSGVAEGLSGPAAAPGKTALAVLLGRDRLAAFMLWVAGLTEALVGLLILITPAWWWPRAAALVLLAGGAGYLVLAQRRAPGTPCGCFGPASAEPISEANVLRAVALGLAAAMSLPAGESWSRALAAAPGLGVAVLVPEGVGLAVLFRAELRSLAWRRATSARSAEGPDDGDCVTADVPLAPPYTRRTSD